MKRILICDDNPYIARILGKGLSRAGLKVDTFTDPQQLLSDFRSGTYALVILDMRMPGVDGITLYKEIRKRDADVKVCFLTAYDVEDEIKATIPDFDKSLLLKKPIMMKDLMALVKSILKEENDSVHIQDNVGSTVRTVPGVEKWIILPERSGYVIIPVEQRSVLILLPIRETGQILLKVEGYYLDESKLLGDRLDRLTFLVEEIPQEDQSPLEPRIREALPPDLKDLEMTF